MNKFNCYFTIRGVAGEAEAPAIQNPIECANLASLLVKLSGSLPGNKNMGIETVGVRIEEVKE